MSNLRQNISVDELMVNTKKTLIDIAKEHNIPNVYSFNKKDLAIEIAKLYGYQEPRPSVTCQDYQIHDSIESNSDTNNYTHSEDTPYFQEYHTDISSYYDIDEIVNNEYPKIKHILNNICKPFKFRIKVIAYLRRHNEIIPEDFKLYTSFIFPYNNDIVNIIKRDLKSELEHLKTQSSGWTLSYFTKFYLHIPIINISRGGTYVKLPDSINKRQATLNINNSKDQDNKCFLWSVIASRVQCNNSHPDRLSNYTPHVSKFDISSLTDKFPIATNDPVINKFENDNDLIINIYSLTDNEIPGLTCTKDWIHDHAIGSSLK